MAKVKLKSAYGIWTGPRNTVGRFLSSYSDRKVRHSISEIVYAQVGLGATSLSNLTLTRIYARQNPRNIIS